MTHHGMQIGMEFHPVTEFHAHNSNALPWDSAEWVPACCAAIAKQDRETALTCLELWDGTTVPHSPVKVLLTALKHEFMSIAKKILRRVPSPRIPWKQLITCAVADCRSTAVLQFLKSEFLLARHDEHNSRKLWRRSTEDIAPLILTNAAAKKDCFVMRMCLRLSPLLTLASSVIIKHNTSPDMLWLIMSKLFEVSKGTSVQAIATREVSLRHLDAVAFSRQNERSPTTRAMARIFIKRALVTFPPSSMVARGSRDFILSLKNKYGVCIPLIIE